MWGSDATRLKCSLVGKSYGLVLGGFYEGDRLPQPWDKWRVERIVKAHDLDEDDYVIARNDETDGRVTLPLVLTNYRGPIGSERREWNRKRDELKRQYQKRSHPTTGPD